MIMVRRIKQRAPSLGKGIGGPILALSVPGNTSALEALGLYRKVYAGISH